MKYFSILTVFCALLFAGNAQAQESQARNASTYSYLGLGMPNDFLSPQGTGMSLIGVAIPDRSKGTLANPALWGTSTFTTIMTGMDLETYRASDEINSASSTYFSFSKFQAQFPVLRERLGISAGLFPATNVSYTLLTDNQITLPTADSLSTVDYISAVTGSGGINRLEVGFGLRLTQNLYVGYAPSLMFGVREEDNQLAFDSSLFSSARYVQRTRYRGFAHRFGALALLPNVFRDRDQIAIGASLSLPVELDAHRKVTSRVSTGQVINDLELIPEDQAGRRNVTYPFETTVGISYFPSRYTLVGGEFHYQQWSEHNSFSGSSDRFMSDRMRFGLGVEYDAYSRGETGLFNSLIYRFGASYDTGHLSIDNTDIETLMFSTGIGIPSRAIGSTIDISIDYGLRGTNSNDLIRERIFALRLSLNLSEMMFMQRRVN